LPECGFGWLCPTILHSSFFILHSPRRGFGRLCPAIPQSAIRNPHSPHGVPHKPSAYNSPPSPPSRWSGGTLDKPWTCPGTIEPSQTPVFDQPHLSSSLYPPTRRLRSVRADGVLPATPR
jgi:hypothetical protein